MFLANDNTNMIIVIASIVGMLILTIIMAIRVRKEGKRYKEEKSVIIEGLLSKTAMTSTINTYISKVTPDTNFSLLYIDFDNYADIVDAFGRKEADKALEKIAYYMLQGLPKRVLMANYRATEFLILMKSEYDRLQVVKYAKDLLELIRRPVKIFKDTSVSFTGSIGICFYPKHGLKFKQLMNSAQIALHDAKKNGGNNFVIYSAEMIGDAKGENVEYHLDIKDAMEKKEFILYYQPIINQTENDFYGAETFVRWNHPKHGILSPVQFLNIMEQSGDISWIGTWGLDTLIKEYYELQKEFPYRDFRFTINLSPKQLMGETISSDFHKIIKKYNMPADYIALEIAEFSIYEKNSTVKQNIAKLKKIGFKIAINGYGLDYSTLSTLDTMPIDIIKLDKKFFEREKESFMKDKLADLIVEFAKNKQKLIISEGIESEEMLQTIKALKIDLVQGYIYSKPILSTELIQYIQKEGWKIKEIQEKEEN